MKDKKDIDRMVDDAINYMDRMENIQLDEYFEVRLQSRINRWKRESGIHRRTFFQSVLRPVFIVLLCIINLATIAFLARSLTHRSAVANGKISREDACVRAMETTYSLDQNTDDIVLIKSMK